MVGEEWRGGQCGVQARNESDLVEGGAVRRERVRSSWDVDSSLKLSPGKLEGSLEGNSPDRMMVGFWPLEICPITVLKKKRKKARRNRPSHALLFSLGKDLGSVDGLFFGDLCPHTERWVLQSLHFMDEKTKTPGGEVPCCSATSNSESRVSVLNHCTLLASPWNVGAGK